MMKNLRIAATAGALVFLATMAFSALTDDWRWSAEEDAVAAAPDSHRVLLENEAVRVLEVVLEPGVREPPHTHRWPSVMTVLEPARLRYYDSEGRLAFDPPARQQPAGPVPLAADWLGPEGLHEVENVDTRTFRALRVEIKE